MNVVSKAYPVKYLSVEYTPKYVTITQNRTRRRVPKGFYFEDNGQKIYVARCFADIFQHGKKAKLYEVDTETKEWKPYEETIVERHIPLYEEPKGSNEIKDLKK